MSSKRMFKLVGPFICPLADISPEQLAGLPAEHHSPFRAKACEELMNFLGAVAGKDDVDITLPVGESEKLKSSFPAIQFRVLVAAADKEEVERLCASFVNSPFPKTREWLHVVLSQKSGPSRRPLEAVVSMEGSSFVDFQTLTEAHRRRLEKQACREVWMALESMAETMQGVEVQFSAAEDDSLRVQAFVWCDRQVKRKIQSSLKEYVSQQDAFGETAALYLELTEPKSHIVMSPPGTAFNDFTVPLPRAAQRGIPIPDDAARKEWASILHAQRMYPVRRPSAAPTTIPISRPPTQENPPHKRCIAPNKADFVVNKNVQTGHRYK